MRYLCTWQHVEHQNEMLDPPEVPGRWWLFFVTFDPLKQRVYAVWCDGPNPIFEASISTEGGVDYQPNAWPAPDDVTCIQCKRTFPIGQPFSDASRPLCAQCIRGEEPH